MLEAYAREVIEMWDNQKPYDTNNGKRRRVFLVSGEYATVSIRTIVGYCHYKKHKGFVTKNFWWNTIVLRKIAPVLSAL